MNADVANATCLKNVLNNYCPSSGQLLSVAKVSLFFRPNTIVEIKEEMCVVLDILTEAMSDKYLGLPTVVGVI